MKLIDKNVIADIKYVPIKTPLAYEHIKNYLQINKQEIDKLALENGVYITCNNIICNKQNYLIFSILSMHDLDFYQTIKQIKFTNNLLFPNNSMTDYQNDFTNFINELNGINSDTIPDESLMKSLIEELNSLQETDFLDYLVYQGNDVQSNSPETAYPKSNAELRSGEYAFVGKLFENNNNNGDWLKNAILLNIIKNYMGDNDTDSTYATLKEEGRIYSGLSMTFPEKGLLLTGCFLAYQKTNTSIVNEYIDKALNKLYNEPEVLEMAKNKFINMFKIINLEYHSGNLLETYNRYLTKPLVFDDIKAYVKKIDIKDIQSFIDHLISSEIVLSMEEVK